MARGKKLTQAEYEERLNKALNMPVIRVDYSEANYKNKFTPCTLRCIEHDITFEQAPENSWNGNLGCSDCHKRNFAERLRDPVVISARAATNMSRWGSISPSSHPDIKAIVRQTSETNGGFTFQRPASKAKMLKTMQEKYDAPPGITSCMQIASIAEKCLKAGFQWKEYTMPSGEKIKYQGSENYLLDELIKTGISEDNIITGRDKMPEIFYMGADNKQHRYYPDIMVGNKIYEVKSPYILTKDLDKNIRKMNATVLAGFEYEFAVYDTDNNGKFIKKLTAEEVRVLLETTILNEQA